jgi:uncharacterized protein YdeI (YjbR/CyaY-like superfamily)
LATATLAGPDARNRFALGFRLRGVKRPETRTRKIAEAVARPERADLLALHSWPKAPI